MPNLCIGSFAKKEFLSIKPSLSFHCLPLPPPPNNKGVVFSGDLDFMFPKGPFKVNVK